MPIDVVQARVHHQELQKLVGNERETIAMFLLRLMEFERDRMYERLGYATMWDFCRRGLGLCESTTGRRLKATRVIERFPGVVEYLRDGRLCTTRILMLRDVLTPENAVNLFEQAARKSMDEIELLVATTKPQPAQTVRLQKLPEPRQAAVAAPTFTFGSEPAPTPAPEASAPSAAGPAFVASPVLASSRPAHRAEIHPTSAQEYVARLPVSRAWVQKLEMAKKLGSHVVPTKDPVAILELALDLFIEKHGKRRGAIAVKSTRASARTPEPEIAAAEVTVKTPIPAPAVTPTDPADHPPARHPAKRDRFTADDLRFIWSRDEGRCTWLLDSGERCGSEYQLEVDHIEAVAKGGATDPRCARLLCRRHNDQHARETFGEAFMKSKKTRHAPC